MHISLVAYKFLVRFSKKIINNMRTSQKWFEHFSANIQIKRVDWLLVPSLNENERKNIVKSVQAWQLGETSDGFHLLKASRKSMEII